LLFIARLSLKSNERNLKF